jgi:hypothetical protein
MNEVGQNAQLGNLVPESDKPLKKIINERSSGSEI